LTDVDREPNGGLVDALLAALAREGPVDEGRARELAAAVEAQGE
jgi:hypothetical protein